MGVLRAGALVMMLAASAAADPLAFVPLPTEPQPAASDGKWNLFGNVKAPRAAAAGSVLSVSIEPYFRWPSAYSEGVLEYPDRTSGVVVDIALRLPSYRRLYYHVSAGSLELDGGEYRGYLVAPVQLGYWVPVFTKKPISIDAGVVGTLVQLEYMAGTGEAMYSTQSTLALGWGVLGYIGFGIDLGPISLGVALGVGFDSRYASIQSAGVTGEVANGLAWDWVVRPSFGIRLGDL